METARNQYDRIVFFDTETVGINPNYIISLAYRYYERGKKPVIGEIRCNPDYEINPEASKVNGFTNELVANWPYFNQEWEKIKPYFEGSLHIGHNIQFDESALMLEFNRYGIEYPEHFELDTLKIARKMIPKSETGNYKLITLCNYFGIIDMNDESSKEKFHAADFDIWATDKVFRKLRELNKEKNGRYDACFIPISLKNNND